VSAAESNKSTGRKNAELTKLVRIKSNGTTLIEANITLDVLRKIGSKFNISGSRSKSKKTMADVLVSFSAGKETQVVNGTFDEFDT